ncbi:efflux RND transporter periplasmic adaptor subunit [Crocinitomicaceae bacterium CZZ-1]|uniref:Efflux RND transporter periplasmic adaptor subunit n=1 Tax=Taishania pollutisoli TaxID=2766479 RepID=A0A8J6PA57_9FLAO|nr:efflux RND transporter periplasmic adaptor subunit [Taishania pollutisoli]MBC9811533.1 efflux RND transporter periplasmic adaptor subunit [Taishania pollutisoli]MBX2948530.1 efflux RND transporter periplasmic adaptor subunit [Crocinitomicaceae bacterium]NGF76268.1 efflux RND transporter periplasmic adaptor subunit [Fluviicola sp. SGL-29]
MIRLFITATVIGLVASCGGKQEEAPQKMIGTYKVVNLEKTNTTLLAEYPASLEGIMDIDIRPKIDGYIEQILVDEGQEVKKGQVLFRISNPQFSQDMQSLAASVAAAESAVATAELQVTKTKPLVDQGIISAFELKNVELALQARKAELQRAKAQYSNGVTNVGYTTIKSPVNGMVGTIPYRIGSYVNSATAQPLTRVSDISTIYAYFSISEKQQLDIVAEIEGKTFQEKIAKIPEVNMVLSNGNLYNHPGKIQTFSGQVNTQTGAFNVRASFPNAEKLLRSGNSATIQIPTYLEHVIIIPQKATVELQDKRMAYILDGDKVKAVPVKVRAVPGGKFFVVDEGLTEKDQLVIEGIGILTEGTVIKPDFVKIADVLKEESK